LRLGPGFATADLIKALGVLPNVRGRFPTSVFGHVRILTERNSWQHGYLQLVAKTLYAVAIFIFTPPPASGLGQLHWWSDVFEPSANFIARGC
jgi:hypothetical protein